MLKSFLKARRPTKVSNEMKYTNEKMTWNTQDTNLSSFVPKANADHTISGQGTSISTLGDSATIPRASYDEQVMDGIGFADDRSLLVHPGKFYQIWLIFVSMMCCLMGLTANLWYLKVVKWKDIMSLLLIYHYIIIISLFTHLKIHNSICQW